MTEVPLTQEEARLCSCSSEIRVLYAIKDLQDELGRQKIATSEIKDHPVFYGKNEDFVYDGLERLVAKEVVSNPNRSRYSINGEL